MTTNTNPTIDELAAQFGVNRRKLQFKIDINIVPAICILYLLAFLDRVNISNAAVYGMSKDLGLVGNQYNIALTIFFVPYIICEIPSNYLLKRFKPHTWLSSCMICFGAVTIGQGFVQNFGQLVATRFLLGLCEAGMFPGCFYLLAMWYTRSESQTRWSFFFASTTLAGAFGGLIAYGIHSLEGAHGLEGWRWIFIIEGAVTSFCAIVLFWVIADFPEDSKFLKENEREYIKAKLTLDAGDSKSESSLTLKSAAKIFKDWKVWLSGFAYFGCVIPAYGYAYFATSIIKSFGHTPIHTQIMSVYPWICAFGWSMGLAYASSFCKNRFFFCLSSFVIAIAGFGILLGEKININVRYGSLFLVASGLYGAMPILVCWTNMNFSGHQRRAVGTGWQVGFGNIGGIIATFSFIAKDAPFYIKGISIAISMTCFSMICCVIYLLGLMRDNKSKANGTWMLSAEWENMTAEEKAIAGDLDPNFRYNY
ncbi:MFS general substrate transporter [Nadsonia fulvescens var. elongata DSM 6958]|uniref:MFS general substrate transporter n=1 Tax=Nadsonia fulvescens var. elongata DSM 6958 TaxID=857566 RepID=A0A1E3PQS9_9ASCO|nr:MFS general substrate transporter [Nadsonia fulvescens var. elongata DSM 6958]